MNSSTDILEFKNIVNLILHYFDHGIIKKDQIAKRHIIEKLSLPYLDDELILNPIVMCQFLVTQFIGLYSSLDAETRSLFDSVYSRFNSYELFLRIRSFDPNHGLYYPHKFETSDCSYFIDRNKPYLITITSKKWLEEEKLGGNELGWIIRPEIKALSAMSFSLKRFYCVFCLNNNPIDIPLNFITDQNKLSPEITEKMKSILYVLHLIDFKNNYDKEIHDDIRFNFRSYQFVDIDRSYELYNNFNINDSLTLRTSFLFL